MNFIRSNNHLSIISIMKVFLSILLVFNLCILVFATEKAINYNDPPYTALHNLFGPGGV